MLYFVAMVLPPLAVLFTGRKTAAILNIPLTLAGWLPGVLPPGLPALLPN